MTRVTIYEGIVKAPRDEALDGSVHPLGAAGRDGPRPARANAAFVPGFDLWVSPLRGLERGLVQAEPVELQLHDELQEPLEVHGLADVGVGA